MPRPETQPIERIVNEFGDDTNEVEKHPAFGVIQFSRIQGRPGKLFGSHLNDHASFIQMTVFGAERHHHLSYDRYHALWDRPIVKLELSAVQFSELLTSMNMGDGVPCTLRNHGGEAIPYIPEDLETEQEKVAQKFKVELRDLARDLQAAEATVNEILNKKSLLKTDKEAIRRAFSKVASFLASHAPFVMDQFTESVEKATKAGKSEIDAFMTNALVATGLEGLRKRLADETENARAITSGDDDE